MNIRPTTCLLLAGLALCCAAPQPPPSDVPQDAGSGGDLLDAGEIPDAGIAEDAGTPDAGTPDAGLGPVSFEVSSGALDPEFSPGLTSYSLTSFTTLESVTVTVRGAFSASVAGAPVQNGVPHVLPSLPIGAGASFEVVLDSVTYTVNIVPPDFPPYTVVVNGPTPGRLFLTPGNFLLVLDDDGSALFFRRLPSQVLDFKRHSLPDGSTFYSYLMDGDAYVLDDAFRPLTSYRLLATPSHPDHPQGQHDFEMLGPKHVIMQADITKTVTNIPPEIPQAPGGSLVIASVVQEVKDGEVIFEWDSTDHPELYGLSVASNDFVNTIADYAHLNSVEVDPFDGHLLLSFRHLDAVLKVDRQTGAILWRLGGPMDSFDTPAAYKPSHQHTAQMLSPSTLILYDNGVTALKSRVLTYELDVSRGMITSVNEWDLGGFSLAMGSVQVLGPTAQLVGAGLHGPKLPDVLEYDHAAQTETFRLTFTGPHRSYRAFKYP